MYLYATIIILPGYSRFTLGRTDQAQMPRLSEILVLAKIVARKSLLQYQRMQCHKIHSKVTVPIDAHLTKLTQQSSSCLDTLILHHTTWSEAMVEKRWST